MPLNDFEIKEINKDLEFTSTEDLKRDVDKEKYTEIGESDRMTLRFRKAQ